MNELSENFNKLDKQQMTEGGAQLSEEKQIKSTKKHSLLRKKGNKENSSHVTVSLKCASSSQHASILLVQLKKMMKTVQLCLILNMPLHFMPNLVIHRLHS